MGVYWDKFGAVCDGDFAECRSSIDPEFESYEKLQEVMLAAGWVREFSRWFCPSCAEKQKDKTP